jgi:putative NADPH-quinone reductase
VSRVLVVYCHPNPESLAAAARDRALAGLAAGGHDVRLNDLYADGFEPAFSADERRRHLEPGAAGDVARYVDDLRWAQALVLVYPTWWSGQPAMLKGWIDRVWVNGVAWDLPEHGNVIKPLLTNIERIVAVTTHGNSKFVNALEGEGGKRTVTRALRSMCRRRTRTTWCAIYGLDRADETDRHAFLDRVERTLAKL